MGEKGRETWDEWVERHYTRQGVIQGMRHLLFVQGCFKFGPPTPEMEENLARIASRSSLLRLGLRLLEVNSWQELLAPDIPNTGGTS